MNSDLKRIVLESYPVLVSCTLLSLMGGYLINAYVEKIVEASIILMMIPPVNGLGGNIGSILGSRLTTMLHLGVVEPKFGKQGEITGCLKDSLLTSLGTFAFGGLIFFGIARALSVGVLDSVKMSTGFLVAGMLSSTFVMLTTILTAFASYRGGMDPDNVVIPLITSIGDMSGVISLILAMRMLGV